MTSRIVCLIGLFSSIILAQTVPGMSAEGKKACQQATWCCAITVQTAAAVHCANNPLCMANSALSCFAVARPCWHRLCAEPVDGDWNYQCDMKTFDKHLLRSTCAAPALMCAVLGICSEPFVGVKPERSFLDPLLWAAGCYEYSESTAEIGRPASGIGM